MTGEAQRASASPETEPDDAQEEPSQDHKDAMDNAQAMARYAPDSRLMLVMEFVKRERLYARLNAFLKLKLR